MAWNQIPKAPSKTFRVDGYVNMLNKYGTFQDNATAYAYEHTGLVPDTLLTTQYETNGLFSKIIDAPAEEAIKHGFDLGLKNLEITEYLTEELENLDWEDIVATALKWTRLYGGAIGVMLVDDGKGLDEPLNLDAVKHIEEIRIYERAIVQPDYNTLYNYGMKSSYSSKFGMPEYYHVNSIYGHFIVHESRCLLFRNGVLPERTESPLYRFWGIPEYVRIRQALRETVTSHGFGVKMLERSTQAIYSMKDLSSLLATDEGEDTVIRRLQAIDMARSILNSIAIDSEGENYDFKTMSLAGVKDVIDTTCNMLSAVTNIPQAILFGRSPAGMNATGESDLENYYNYVEKIQKLNLKKNMQRLLDILIRIGLKDGSLEEKPKVKLTFSPLWSMNEKEKTEIESKKVATQQAKANTAKLYVDMGVLDPSEVRNGLKSNDEFEIESLLDEELDDVWNGKNIPDDDDDDDDIEIDIPAPENPSEPMPMFSENNEDDEDANENSESKDTKTGVGVIVMNGNKILTGYRSDTRQYCGPGGHIEKDETPLSAAMRETFEEFGIIPNDLKLLGRLDCECNPYIYLCTSYYGTVKESDEITAPCWLTMEDLQGINSLFQPFAESLDLLRSVDISTDSAKKHLTNADTSDRIDDEQFFTASNGKVYKKNTETGETSGLGPDIDSQSQGFGDGFAGDLGQEHLEKRHAEGHYQDLTVEQYEERALDLLSQEIGGDIHGFKAKDGTVIRYNSATGDYAIGVPGERVKTMYPLRGGMERFEKLRTEKEES